MAKIQKGRNTSAAKKSKKVTWEFPLTKNNFVYLAIGLGIIILGFILMATGITEEPALPEGKWNNPMAVTIAPILLIIGYCIVVPLALLKYFGKKSDEAN